jgi:hypothetical protein
MIRPSQRAQDCQLHVVAYGANVTVMQTLDTFRNVIVAAGLHGAAWPAACFVLKAAIAPQSAATSTATASSIAASTGVFLKIFAYPSLR